jgi:hypothetical protein
MSSSSLGWLDLAQDPHKVSQHLSLIFSSVFNHFPQKFSLEFSLKTDVYFEKQSNSVLPVLKLRSLTTMSELFRRGNDFDDVLKQLNEVFHDDIAELWAERHFSWSPVSSSLESSEQSCSFSFLTFLTPKNLKI